MLAEPWRTYGIDIDKAFRVFVVRPAERRRLDEAAAQMSACEPTSTF